MADEQGRDGRRLVLRVAAAKVDRAVVVVSE
jgi:hypothetical protein